MTSILWMLLLAIVVGVPIGVCLRWPDLWVSRKLRGLAERAWDWFTGKAASWVGDPPVLAVPELPPAGWRESPAPRHEPRPLPDAPAGPPNAPQGGFTADGIPGDHAAAAARIADFEPETDEDWLDFLAREALAAHAYGEAWLAHTETLANAVGLDPSVTLAAGLLADAHTDMGEMHAMLANRLQQVYQLVYAHLDNDGTLPYNPGFLSAEGS